ncbi:MAG: ArsR family transcriptional regulator [Candidatus Levybacteria bacterium]|nr:ArsR family transcriptional regulator [Candidatus Levybacteria bacterium]
MSELSPHGIKQEGRLADAEIRLSEKEVYSFISAFGNNEAKALLFTAMKDGKPYTKSALHTRMVKIQGDNPSWIQNKGNAFQYCEDTLVPIGVIKKVVNLGLPTRVVIEKYGKEKGVPFAGALLEWSLNHPDVSLYQVFGQTASKYLKKESKEEKKRSVETRLRILEALIGNNKILSQSELANLLRENPHLVAHHLDSLSESGIITKISMEAGKPYSKYKLTNRSVEQPESYREYKTLTGQVFEIIREHGRFFTVDEVTQTIIDKYSYTGDKESLKPTIGGILSHFVRKGYAVHKKFKRGFQSEISPLSETQKEAIDSLLHIINGFRLGEAEITNRGRESADRIISNPELVSRLMQKAKDNSPHGNKISKDKTISILISIIGGSKDGITTTEIRKKYPRLSPSRLRTLLLESVKKGLLVSESTKFGNRFKVK